MQLQAELQAHRTIVCGGLRLAAGAYTVNEVVDLRLERFAPASKEALLALFHKAVLGELREVILARYRVDTQRALGADDFALNVAAGCGAAHLNVSGGVVIELGQRETVVVVVVICQTGADISIAGCKGIDRIALEEPTCKVGVVAAHLDEPRNVNALLDAFQMCLEHAGRVERYAFEQDRLADRAGADLLLRLCVGRVEAAHEADREALAAVLGYGLLDLLAVLEGLSQRLLAEDMLLGLAGCQTRCLVSICAGCHNDCVNLGIVYQLVYIGVAIRYAEFLLKRLDLALGAGANRYNLCVRITLQAGGVHSAHHTDANDTETNLLHL